MYTLPPPHTHPLFRAHGDRKADFFGEGGLGVGIGRWVYSCTRFPGIFFFGIGVYAYDWKGRVFFSCEYLVWGVKFWACWGRVERMSCVEGRLGVFHWGGNSMGGFFLVGIIDGSEGRLIRFLTSSSFLPQAVFSYSRRQVSTWFCASILPYPVFLADTLNPYKSFFYSSCTAII